jgi:hypothetical protein
MEHSVEATSKKIPRSETSFRNILTGQALDDAALS